MAKKPINVTDITSLRNFALDTLQRLVNHEIDIEEAAQTSKLTENVVSTLKLELEYARLFDKREPIEFLENHSANGKLIEMKPKQLGRSK